MIYFWSDPHFNHRKILDFCPARREWADSAEGMNEVLIANWNAAVRPQDTVWLLGDFGFTYQEVQESEYSLPKIFARLQGHKMLVAGNHDEKNPKVMKLPWERVEKLWTLRDGPGRRAELCHYPLETWKGAHHGALMLHGHSHGSLRRKLPHRYDVGVDVEPFPISLDALFLRAQAEKFEITDHHKEDL